MPKKHPLYDNLEPRYFCDLKRIMKFSKSKNRPYFLENKDWFFITKRNDFYTFELTELGQKNPKVMENYMDFYNIKKENIFNYAADCNLNTEFKHWSKESITKSMKKDGATDKEIKEAIDLWLNIDEIMAKEKDDD